MINIQNHADPQLTDRYGKIFMDLYGEKARKQKKGIGDADLRSGADDLRISVRKIRMTEGKHG